MSVYVWLDVREVARELALADGCPLCFLDHQSSVSHFNINKAVLSFQRPVLFSHTRQESSGLKRAPYCNASALFGSCQNQTNTAHQATAGKLLPYWETWEQQSSSHLSIGVTQGLCQLPRGFVMVAENILAWLHCSLPSLRRLDRIISIDYSCALHMIQIFTD